MRNHPCAAALVLGCAAYSLISACGWGRSPTAPDAPNPPGSPGPGVSITATGLSQHTIEIPVGGRLTITNGDDVAHDMGSDPHPSHDDCPELNRIGLLQPGQSRTSGPLVEARTCGMHDHLRPRDASLHLRITIR
jgi:hypothetical protein